MSDRRDCNTFFHLVDIVPGIWIYFNKRNSTLHFNNEACTFFDVKYENQSVKIDDKKMVFISHLTNSNLLLESLNKIKKMESSLLPLVEYTAISDTSANIFLVRLISFMGKINTDGDGTLVNLLNLSTTTIPSLGIMLANGISTIDNYDNNATIDTKSIRLSHREHLVLFLIVYGKTRMEIADLLHICVNTVDSYHYNLKNKFNAFSKNELIRKAIHAGFASSIPAGLIHR
ncbi:helix-turn-helix transcriptional regulator [Salmonella enterica subsp. enterica serovar Sandiego]|nr:helix-turn-helix transcriptional regulator [Salmonella enterica subsp. enterica serovar Sandiego]